MVEMVEPVTEMVLEAPAGLVRVRAECSDGRVERITFENVPSFVRRRSTRRSRCPGVGSLSVDVAYGGAFCAFVDAAALGLRDHARRGARARRARRADPAARRTSRSTIAPPDRPPVVRGLRRPAAGRRRRPPRDDRLPRPARPLPHGHGHLSPDRGADRARRDGLDVRGRVASSTRGSWAGSCGARGMPSCPRSPAGRGSRGSTSWSSTPRIRWGRVQARGHLGRRLRRRPAQRATAIRRARSSFHGRVSRTPDSGAAVTVRETLTAPAALDPHDEPLRPGHPNVHGPRARVPEPPRRDEPPAAGPDRQPDRRRRAHGHARGHAAPARPRPRARASTASRPARPVANTRSSTAPTRPAASRPARPRSGRWPRGSRRSPPTPRATRPARTSGSPSCTCPPPRAGSRTGTRVQEQPQRDAARACRPPRRRRPRAPRSARPVARGRGVEAGRPRRAGVAEPAARRCCRRRRPCTARTSHPRRRRDVAAQQQPVVADPGRRDEPLLPERLARNVAPAVHSVVTSPSIASS